MVDVEIAVPVLCRKMLVDQGWISSEVNEYLLQFKVDKINSADIEKLYRTTKVTDEIKWLRDTYSAKRYFCEKGAADAISSFVDHMEKQYGLDTE